MIEQGADSNLGRYVYVIGQEAGQGGYEYVKIGISSSPNARLNELQTGNPKRLSVLGHFNAGAMAGRLERLVHAVLDTDRMQGEWFVFSSRTQALIELLSVLVESEWSDADVARSPPRSFRAMVEGGDLGERLDRLHIRRSELAFRFGVTPAAVSNWISRHGWPDEVEAYLVEQERLLSSPAGEGSEAGASGQEAA